MLYGLVGFALLALLPVWRIPGLDTPNVEFGAVMAQFAIVTLVAMGLNIVVGHAGLLDLGYVGFYALGAYTVALLTSPQSRWNRMGSAVFDVDFFSTRWAWLSCVPIAMIIAALCALVFGTATLRLRADFLAVLTLGFGATVSLVATNLGATGEHDSLDGIAYPHVWEGRVTGGVFSTTNSGGHLPSGVWWYWLTLAVILVVVVAFGNLERSRVGRSWAAIREDETAAETVGVPTFRFKLWAFVIGALIGGLSGALYAGQQQSVAPVPNFTTMTSLLFLAAVVIGGRGNKLGAVLGAFLIVYLPARLLGVEVLGVDLADLKYLFFTLAMVAFVLLRPQGLLPVHQKLLAYWRRAGTDGSTFGLDQGDGDDQDDDDGDHDDGDDLDDKDPGDSDEDDVSWGIEAPWGKS